MQFTNHDLVRVIQTVLFVSGINTLIQTVLGTRLPAVMGNSFYFLLPTISIVLSPDLVSIPDPSEVPYKNKTKNPSPILQISTSQVAFMGSFTSFCLI